MRFSLRRLRFLRTVGFTHLLLVEVPLLVQLARQQRIVLVGQPFKLAMDQALLLCPRTWGGVGGSTREFSDHP